MKSIYKISKKWNLHKFFTKLFNLNIKKSAIEINKKYFNLISDSLLDFCEKNCKSLLDNYRSKYSIEIKYDLFN